MELDVTPVICECEIIKEKHQKGRLYSVNEFVGEMFYLLTKLLESVQHTGYSSERGFDRLYCFVYNHLMYSALFS